MEDFADLKYDYIKLEADLSVTWTVSDTFKNCIITLERKCWRNEQYSRRGGLEIPGIPNGTPDSQLEDKVREVFDKIDSAVKSKNIEACHWIKNKHGGRRVIIKLSKRKDTDRIRKNKKKLKSSIFYHWMYKVQYISMIAYIAIINPCRVKVKVFTMVILPTVFE